MKKAMKSPWCFRLSKPSCLGGLLLVCVLSAPVFGQTPTPDAGLQLVGFIPLPNWTTPPTGNTNQADAMTFNPQNGVIYIADRVNDGATAIDTKTWTVLGTSVPPGCGVQTATAPASTNCRPSGILVAPDLQKLVFTARGPLASNPNAPPSGLWVFDLRSPTSAPVLIPTPLPDFVEYNPINHLIYLKTSPTGATGDTIAVLDPVSGKAVAQIPMGVATEQMKFNPVDGLIYDAVTELGQEGLAKIDPNTNAIVSKISLHTSSVTCTPHQLEIDPVTDTAVVSCSEAAVTVDLRNGNIINTYPQVIGADTTAPNLNLRHTYVAARSNTATTTGCAQDSLKFFPVVGVVSTAPSTGATGPGQFLGLACGGRTVQIAADSLRNNVYVSTVQYPVNASNATSGTGGVLVFHDPGALVTGTPANTEQAFSQTTLAAVGGSGISGSVSFSLRRRSMFVDAGLTGVAAGSTSTDLTITTTAGNEVVHCGVNASGTGFCQGRLVGDPLIGGVVDVGSGGKLVASGPITLGATIPTFVSTDAFLPEE